VEEKKTLNSCRLTSDDWAAIRVVCSWLRPFRDATLKMSKTERPMLSHPQLTLKSLSNHIQDVKSKLPNKGSRAIREALTCSGQKLGSYLAKTYQSRDYAWAACRSNSKSVLQSVYRVFCAVLDPSIPYAELKASFSDDEEAIAYFNESEGQLRAYYNDVRSSSKRFAKSASCDTDEWELFCSRPTDHEDSDPVTYWKEKQTRFPVLSEIARDIFSIPGK
jgi:hypothetical protein